MVTKLADVTHLQVYILANVNKMTPLTTGIIQVHNNNNNSNTDLFYVT